MKASAILLSIYLICTTSYVLHLLLFKFYREGLPRALRSTLSLRILPAVSVLISLILVITAQRSDRNGLTGCSEEDLRINPDLGGIGVLLGMFLPCIVLLLVLVSGHWNASTFGAKELCMAQLASMVVQKSCKAFRG